MAYLATFIPPEKRAKFVDVSFLKYLENGAGKISYLQPLREHRGPLVVLIRPNGVEPDMQFLAGEFHLRVPFLVGFGLSADVSDCRVVDSDFAPLGTPPLFACTPTWLSSSAE